MCFILNIFSRLKRVEERLDLLEYHEPESIEKFIEKYQYEKIDDLYYLDREYFLRHIHYLGCAIIEEFNTHGLFKYKHYICGDIVGKVYQDCLFWRKQDVFEEELKNGKVINYNIGKANLKKANKKTLRKEKIVKGGKNGRNTNIG